MLNFTIYFANHYYRRKKKRKTLATKLREVLCREICDRYPYLWCEPRTGAYVFFGLGLCQLCYLAFRAVYGEMCPVRPFLNVAFNLAVSMPFPFIERRMCFTMIPLAKVLTTDLTNHSRLISRAINGQPWTMEEGYSLHRQGDIPGLTSSIFIYTYM